MERSFSIITVSKGRLDHLKQSLPSMLDQPAREVIVVDYSCPSGTADHVRDHFPSATVVAVEGEGAFSNWRGRNAGAAAATGDLLVFCDADVILAQGAISWISERLPLRAYAELDPKAESATGPERPMASNQLKGFQVVPSRAFRRVGGYDEVLEGYAAGGDTDLADRLRRAGLGYATFDPGKVVQSVIDHGDDERLTYFSDPVRISYGAGLLYRAAKFYLMRMLNRRNLPLKTRQELYRAARGAMDKLDSEQSAVALSVDVDVQPVRMPRQLGFKQGTRKVSLKVSLQGNAEMSGGTNSRRASTENKRSRE